MQDDLYARLGVAVDASNETIATAFRRRAKELHPDLHPGDAVISEEFKQLTSAYRVLGRPSARAAYDARRSAPAPHAPAPVPTTHEPVFRTIGRARAAIWSGVALVVVGLAAAGVLASVDTGDSAKAITLWIVVGKLIVCGGLLWGTGAWRLGSLRAARVPTGR